MNDLSFGVARSRSKGILLLHGLTGAPAEMRLLGRRLTRAGFALSTPLLAGHGADQQTLLRSTWRDWLASARDAYR